MPRDNVVRVHASSGTTGKATVVGYTQRDVNNWAELMARSLMCAGCRCSDIVHNAYGYGLFTGGLGMHYGVERLGQLIIRLLSIEKEDTILKALSDYCGTHEFRYGIYNDKAFNDFLISQISKNCKK